MPLLICGSLISPTTLTSYSAFICALCYVNDQGIIEIVEEREHDCSVTTDEIITNFLNQRNLLPAAVDVITLQRGQFLIPGFIDTHTHAPQVPNLGAGQQHELLDWLANVTFPMEARFRDVEFARKAYTKVVRRIIDSGTTTCCYYGTLHLDSTKVLADLVHKHGQRAFVGKCNMDSNSPENYVEPSAEVSVKDTEQIISYIKSLPSLPDGSPLVQPILTPRFAISCSHQLLTSLGSLAKSDPQLAIQTHISENTNEIVFTKNLFSNIPHTGELTYAGVYDYFGLLRHNTVLAHGVHLEDSEVELIKQRGTGISHCPTSNFNLTSGVAKVGTWLDKGVKVGLGTDVSGGYSPSILTAIQHASIASKVVAMATPPPITDTGFASHPLKIATLFYLSTMGGASLCNLENQIGSLEVGKAFDAIVVDIRNDGSTQNPNLWGVADDEDIGVESRRNKGGAEPGDLNIAAAGVKENEELDAMLERFLFCGDDRNIRRVYVQGKFVGGVDFATRRVVPN